MCRSTVYTVTNVAQKLSISRYAVYQAIRDGELRPIRRHGWLRFSARSFADFEAYRRCNEVRYDLAAAASWLGVSQRIVRKLVRLCKITHYRVGPGRGRQYWLPESSLALLAEILD